MAKLSGILLTFPGKDENGNYIPRPFAEQVDFFKAKLGNLVPTARWDDLWKEAHDTAFMVAGAQKADLLADLAGEVDKAISTGTSLGEFRKNFDEIIAKHGWSYTGSRNWRTKVIYQTNISTSYAAGREAQIAAGGFEYKLYKHSDSVMHPRPLHQSWDGLVLPVGHAFWATHSAPNGWGCKCRIVGIRNQAAAKRLGGKWDVEPPAGWDQIDAKTGEPVGIDKGWGYQPGASVLRMQKQIAAKAAKLPEPLASALTADVLFITSVPKFDSVGEAEAWMMQNLSDKVGLSKTFKPDGLQQIAKNILEVNRRFDMPERFKYIGDPTKNTGTSYRGWSTKVNAAYAEWDDSLLFQTRMTDYETFAIKHAANEQVYRASRSVAAVQQTMKIMKYDQAMIDLVGQIKTRQWSTGDTVDDVMHHELGHRLLSLTPKSDPIHALLNKSMRQGWHYLSSDYARKNKDEYFAETFSFYLKGEAEHFRIDPDVLAWLKEKDKFHGK